MVVKISKPKFNLREKISQLDYDALPYDKIPIGSVVQTVVNYPQAPNAMEGTNRARQDVAVRAHQPGTSDVFAEVTGADYRTSISPRFYSSMLLLDLTFLFGGNNNSSISGFKFMQSRMQDMSNPFDLVFSYISIKFSPSALKPYFTPSYLAKLDDASAGATI